MNAGKHLRRRKTEADGFSLVELLVAMAIAATVVGFALPAYRQYVLRAHRTDAANALLAIGQAQEKHYLQNSAFASTPAQLGIGGTEFGFYQLEIQLADGNFVATASATGPQAEDTDCASLSLSGSGDRSALSESGADTTATCWR